MSNKASTVSFSRKPKVNNVNKLFPESVICQMLHKTKALEGGKFGFVNQGLRVQIPSVACFLNWK